MAGESWDGLNGPYSGGTLRPIKVKLSWEETMRVTSDRAGGTYQTCSQLAAEKENPEL